MIILTKYHGATNTRGARISAHAPGWGVPIVYVSYPYEKSGAECHAEAVRALMQKIGISSEKFRAFPIPGGYAFAGSYGGLPLTLKAES